MKPRQLIIPTAAAVFATVVAPAWVSGRYGYERGYDQAQVDDEAGAKEIRSEMAEIGVCRWTKIYAAYMGCDGVPIPQPNPHRVVVLPDTWNNGESGGELHEEH